MTNIGDFAFDDCSGLTSVTIPESLETVGGYAFRGCTSLTSISIPRGITEISSHLFSGCSSLTSITIPESVTTIGYGAFENCSALTSITIPKGVTKIDFATFRHCSTLTSITIPENVQSIGEGAFSGCSGLTSITIPESVTTIGSNAFSDCGKLRFVEMKSNAIVSRLTMASIFGTQVEEYVLGDAVTSIGNYAFSGCSGLKSVNIPESVTSIGLGAFKDCSSITKVEYAGIRNICEMSFADAYSNPVFYAGGFYVDGEAVKDVVIPEGVTVIGTYSFQNCSALESLTIPEGVTAIGSNAFKDCMRLTSLCIPKSVTWIGSRAFSNCVGLTSVTCLVKSSNRSTADLVKPEEPTDSEPVKPEPGVDPSEITERLYPFNPAHNTELDPPTTANCEETTDVTAENVFTEAEIRELWLAYYKKVYNTRTATTRRNNKVYQLLNNPYFIRGNEAVTLNQYRNEWNNYNEAVLIYEQEWENYRYRQASYETYLQYETIPVPAAGDGLFEGVDQSDATLYVYENVMDAYKVTFPWNKFGTILPIDPSDVREMKSSDANNDENAPIYDLNGRRLTEKPKKGFYIQGGKKYLAQ